VVAGRRLQIAKRLPVKRDGHEAHRTRALVDIDAEVGTIFKLPLLSIAASIQLATHPHLGGATAGIQQE
jgi:hypothetical protein